MFIDFRDIREDEIAALESVRLAAAKPIPLTEFRNRFSRGLPA